MKLIALLLAAGFATLAFSNPQPSLKSEAADAIVKAKEDTLEKTP
jgi:hypothetical protein